MTIKDALPINPQFTILTRDEVRILADYFLNDAGWIPHDKVELNKIINMLIDAAGKDVVTIHE